MKYLPDSSPQLLVDVSDRVPSDLAEAADLVGLTTVVDTVADRVDLDQVADSLADAADVISEAAAVTGRRAGRGARAVGRAVGRGATATVRVVRRRPETAVLVGVAAAAVFAAFVVTRQRATPTDTELHLADAA